MGADADNREVIRRFLIAEKTSVPLFLWKGERDGKTTKGRPIKTS